MLHYTISSFKPWNWWSSWIISDTMNVWQALRARLPPPSTAPTSTLALALRVLAPAAALVVLARRTPGVLPAIAAALSPGSHAQLGPPGPRRRGALAWTTLAVALASLVVAMGVANGLVVPAQVEFVGLVVHEAEEPEKQQWRQVSTHSTSPFPLYRRARPWWAGCSRTSGQPLCLQRALASFCTWSIAGVN